LILLSFPKPGRSENSKEETIRILIGKYKKDFSVSGAGIKLRSVNEGK
jgi:hypothetical protein